MTIHHENETFVDKLINITPLQYLKWYVQHPEKRPIYTFDSSLATYFWYNGISKLEMGEFKKGERIYLEIGVQKASIEIPEWIIEFYDDGNCNNFINDEAKVIIRLAEIIKSQSWEEGYMWCIQGD